MVFKPAKGLARILAFTALILVCWAIGSPLAESRTSQPELLPAITVEKGDTLWGIALRIAEPDQDIRDVVERLVKLNRMNSPALTPGQTLFLPRAGR